MKRVRVVISGRVQGVFFRQSAAEKARELGISGWARNLPDGRVEAVFQGPDDAVNGMLRWAGEGPTGARVDDVQFAEEPSDADLNGFRVR